MRSRCIDFGEVMNNNQLGNQGHEVYQLFEIDTGCECLSDGIVDHFHCDFFGGVDVCI